jgi:hypothetical protein
VGLAVQLSLADDRQPAPKKARRIGPLASTTVTGAWRRIAVVGPITHSPPIDATAAIEISAVTNVSASGLIRRVLERLRRSGPVRLAGPRPATGGGTLSGERVVRVAAAEAHRRVRAKLLELARMRRLKQAPRTV